MTNTKISLKRCCHSAQIWDGGEESSVNTLHVCDSPFERVCLSRTRHLTILTSIFSQCLGEDISQMSVAFRILWFDWFYCTPWEVYLFLRPFSLSKCSQSYCSYWNPNFLSFLGVTATSVSSLLAESIFSWSSKYSEMFICNTAEIIDIILNANLSQLHIFITCGFYLLPHSTNRPWLTEEKENLLGGHHVEWGPGN